MKFHTCHKYLLPWKHLDNCESPAVSVPLPKSAKNHQLNFEALKKDERKNRESKKTAEYFPSFLLLVRSLLVTPRTKRKLLPMHYGRISTSSSSANTHKERTVLAGSSTPQKKSGSPYDNNALRTKRVA
eukprot:gene5339-3838_t